MCHIFFPKHAFHITRLPLPLDNTQTAIMKGRIVCPDCDIICCNQTAFEGHLRLSGHSTPVTAARVVPEPSVSVINFIEKRFLHSQKKRMLTLLVHSASLRRLLNLLPRSAKLGRASGWSKSSSSNSTTNFNASA